MVGIVSADQIMAAVKASGLTSEGKPDRRRREVRKRDSRSEYERECEMREERAPIDPIVDMLTKARQAQGLTQAELARLIAEASPSKYEHVSYKALFLYERGYRSPSLTRLRAWARALDIEVTAWPVFEDADTAITA